MGAAAIWTTAGADRRCNNPHTRQGALPQEPASPGKRLYYKESTDLANGAAARKSPSAKILAEFASQKQKLCKPVDADETGLRKNAALSRSAFMAVGALLRFEVLGRDAKHVVALDAHAVQHAPGVPPWRAFVSSRRGVRRRSGRSSWDYWCCLSRFTHHVILTQHSFNARCLHAGPLPTDRRPWVSAGPETQCGLIASMCAATASQLLRPHVTLDCPE